MAFYPRKRAAKETPSYGSFPPAGGPCKPLNFFCYKAGMTHVMGKDMHQQSSTFGQEIVVPCTVLECPPLKVFGIRVYGKSEKSYGARALFDVFAEKFDKELGRKIPNFFEKKSKKEKKEANQKSGKPLKERKTVSDLEKEREKILYARLLAHTQPRLTGIGKKKPEVVEIGLGGNVQEQIAYCKQMLGRELPAAQAFEEKDFADIKAVTRGKGIQGPVKRFGIKDFGRKAKYHRKVGTLGPWSPATIMFTVPRPGQMGYHTRTEYSKRILKISEKPEQVNPESGFKHYGIVKNNFLLVAGSVPGPSKRLIGLRKPTRAVPEKRWLLSEITYLSKRPSKRTEKAKFAGREEEETKAKKVTASIVREMKVAAETAKPGKKQ